MAPSALLPASLRNSADCMPSPPMKGVLMPRVRICRTIGAAWGSMPPKTTTSGFLALSEVRMAVKSVDLSVVYSRPTTSPPAALTALTTSSIRPWP